MTQTDVQAALSSPIGTHGTESPAVPIQSTEETIP